MRGVSGRLSRATRTFAALGFLALGFGMLLAPVGGAQTDEGGIDGSYAKLSKNGWWERKPNLPNVPANALGVAAENGADTKVAALGIDMFVPDDELLVGLTLQLRESTDPGANFPPITDQGQAQPQSKISVAACPITGIWTPADGGDKAAGVPVADCDLGRGDGVRNAAGVWTFDLSMLAELWMSDTIEQNGILLIERVAAPLSFQLSFQDLSTNTPALDLQTDFLEEPEDTAAGGEDTSDFTDTSSGSTTPDDDSSFFSAVGSEVTGTTDTPFGITDTPPTTAPAPAVPEPQQDPTPVANRTPTKGKLPLGTLALLPLALGLALLLGVVLGPEGDPATARRREGGLSRALARRSPAPQ